MHRLLTGPLSVERFTLEIADLPPHLHGMRVVQLSDFHFDGLRLSPWLLQQAIAASNQVEPDLVFLTGDFITDATAPMATLASWLQRLTSRAGVFAVLGNHDIMRRKSREAVTRALEQVGIPVLWNQVVYPLGPGLAIVGLAEYWSPDFNLEAVFNQISPTVPRLVLAHNPDVAELLQPYRADLQLSGHTHGGQLVIPGVGNVSVLGARLYRRLSKQGKRRLKFLQSCHRVVRHWEWSQGLHQVGSNRLYINRGLGTYLPGRLFCPPEVTVITLEQASTQTSDREESAGEIVTPLPPVLY